jgi:choline dehydrogenase
MTDKNDKRFTLPAALPAIRSKILERTKTFKNSKECEKVADIIDDGGEKETFDYIVVGGGTAGLTIAARLAEDPSISVAVIEAGPKSHILSTFIESIPGADVLFVGTKEKFPVIDWGFKTVPDPDSENQRRSYARGKCVGGRYVQSLPYTKYTRGVTKIVLFGTS